MKKDKITTHAGPVALLAGLIFVSHPVQTQAVTYIVQRAASMAALFYLASLCFYVRSRLLQDEKRISGLVLQRVVDNSHSSHVHQGNSHHTAVDDLAL